MPACMQPTLCGALCRRMGIVKSYTLWPWMSLCKICNRKKTNFLAGVSEMFKVWLDVVEAEERERERDSYSLWRGKKESIVVWLRSPSWCRRLHSDSDFTGSDLKAKVIPLIFLLPVNLGKQVMIWWVMNCLFSVKPDLLNLTERENCTNSPNMCPLKSHSLGKSKHLHWSVTKPHYQRQSRLTLPYLCT